MKTLQEINEVGFREGWGIFYNADYLSPNSTHNKFELQRIDESKSFPNDNEVQKRVCELAFIYTDSAYSDALRFLSEESPYELDNYVRYCGYSRFKDLMQRLGINPYTLHKQ